MAFKNTILLLFSCSIKKKRSFSIRHSVIYPVRCKLIKNPFRCLINRVTFSMPMFSAVHIQIYHIFQIRRKNKRTYFRLLLKINICMIEGGKYLKVLWLYWDNSKCHKYAVFLTKSGNTEQQKSTLDSIL